MINGALVISLDFELMTGVFDKRNINSYGNNILGTHAAIIKTLNLFEKYNIHCTWATVGVLFYDCIDVLKKEFPSKFPNYIDSKLSIYNHLKNLESPIFERYYSGLSSISIIKSTSHQEIGTHTFSHYYCLEEGQFVEDFKADLNKAIEISHQNEIEIRSIVFPRNQVNEKYLKVCADLGLTSYRGVESIFFQNPRSQKKIKFFHRMFRFIDSYINISGSNSYKINDKVNFLNIPASFFFRPYSRKLFFIESLKLMRLKNAMTDAAIKGEVFHLWWHPHNHGANTDENLHQLELLLIHFNELKLKYNMASYNMSEISDYVKSK
ncbi:polysaccharide deacetylase family protein [Flavobacterium sp.]|uniref:polysaccharide deacetylase family protein n=1 Tax=Flavobacterium sp. TaxID=239 RepID=UPI0040471F2B